MLLARCVVGISKHIPGKLLSWTRRGGRYTPPEAAPFPYVEVVGPNELNAQTFIAAFPPLSGRPDKELLLPTAATMAGLIPCLVPCNATPFFANHAQLYYIWLLIFIIFAVHTFANELKFSAM